MNFSYWENKEFISGIDVVVVGSGITGLSTAIHLKRRSPKLKVTILERGFLPWGASSKNAGFACFGSLGEILDDLATLNMDEMFALVKKRNDGLKSLIDLLGKDALDYQQNGGFELFTPNQKDEFETCKSRLQEFNKLFKSEFGTNVYSIVDNQFGFNNIIGIIKNKCEAQIDTGKMMNNYLALAKKEGIRILNGAEVDGFRTKNNGVSLSLKGGLEMEVRQLVVCSNGFAKQLLNEDVEPARAQVLITKPIENLPFKGTFHYDKGYYYFRNINDRILFGGGRNLNITAENTSKMETTGLIQSKLAEILKTVILPDTPFEIDYSWAGVMGVGESKEPIVKELEANVYCGVRLGGMGVALGTSVGKDLADLVLS